MSEARRERHHKRARLFKVFGGLVPLFAIVFVCTTACAQASGSDHKLDLQGTITIQNWQNYREYMPDGMQMLFEGKYFWKMPPDVAMRLGPTELLPLPTNYLDATEQYSSQVKLVELGGGSLTLSGYAGGIPFPKPEEPHKGWKILANLWFRYLPHLTVDTNGVVCTVDSSNSISCKAGMKVYRQLSFNTDPGIARNIPGAEGKYFTQYEMVKEPEQERYTTVLTISYADLSRHEDVYVFIPSLRRYQPMSPMARCSADLGTDETPDDRRFGFNSNLTQIKADLIGEKKILSLVDYAIPAGRVPENYDMPLGWPEPSWGKWQLRDVFVVNITKLSDEAEHCLGKRVVYVDKETYAPYGKTCTTRRCSRGEWLRYFRASWTFRGSDR
jgi:hypothetical protein